MTIREIVSDKKIRILLFSFLILFLGLFSFTFASLGDYYVLKASGDWMLENGKLMRHLEFFHYDGDVVIQQWLYCILMSLAAKAGALCVYLTQLLWMGLSYFIIRIFLKPYIKDSFVVLVIFTISIFIGAHYYFYVSSRPVTLMLLLLEIVGLDRFRLTNNAKWLLFLPLSMLFEINMHGTMWPLHYVVILPFVVPFFKRFVKNEIFDKEQLIKLFLPVLVMTATMLINPYGIDMITHLFHALHSKAFAYVAIAELQPIFVEYGEYFAIMCSLIPFIIYTIIRKGLSSTTFWFALGFMLSACLVSRNLMFVFISSIFVFRDFARCLKKDIFDKRISFLDTISVKAAAIGATVVLIAVFVMPTSFNITKYFEPGNTWFDSLHSRYNTSAHKYILENADKNDKIFAYGNLSGYFQSEGFTNLYIDTRPELFMKELNHKENYLVEFYNVMFDENKSKSQIEADIKAFVNKEDYDYYFLFYESNDAYNFNEFNEVLKKDPRYNLDYDDGNFLVLSKKTEHK